MQAYVENTPATPISMVMPRLMERTAMLILFESAGTEHDITKSQYSPHLRQREEACRRDLFLLKLKD